jgi:hypothetical protein
MKQNSYKSFYIRRINLLLWPTYINDVLCMNNEQFHTYVDSIYPGELELKDTTESSYLGIHYKTDAGRKLTTQLYNKRDDLKFAIVNVPYICSNIPLSPAYGVYISQLIRYANNYSTYNQLQSWGGLLTDKMMLQRFLESRLMSAFHKFYGCYNDLIYKYKLSLSRVVQHFSYQQLGRTWHTVSA